MGLAVAGPQTQTIKYYYEDQDGPVQRLQQDFDRASSNQAAPPALGGPSGLGSVQLLALPPALSAHNLRVTTIENEFLALRNELISAYRTLPPAHQWLGSPDDLLNPRLLPAFPVYAVTRVGPAPSNQSEYGWGRPWFAEGYDSQSVNPPLPGATFNGGEGTNVTPGTTIVVRSVRNGPAGRTTSPPVSITAQ